MTSLQVSKVNPLEVVGRVHSVETFGTVDGPGTRLVVFFQGCPMRCKYCHNPDTWAFAIRSRIAAEMSTTRATDALIDGAADMGTVNHGIADGSHASGATGATFATAAEHAVASANSEHTSEQPGSDMSVKEILTLFDRNRPFYRHGGITITGGEPMAQPVFAAALFKAAHQDPKGRIHTCLDTSAATFTKARAERFSDLLDETDMVLLDIKCSSPEIHKSLTGLPQNHALEFGDELSRRKIPTLIRHVVVPGITDSVEELEGVGRIIGNWDNVVGLDLLPYHTMGIAKYNELGVPYPLEGVEPMDAKKIPELRRIVLIARALRRKERGL